MRARRSAPVSAPCTWEEVAAGKADPAAFTLANMPARIDKSGDVWADLKKRGYSLKRPIEKLRELDRSSRRT